MTDVIKDQVFAWNKYIKYYLVCQCSDKSFQYPLIFDFVNNSKYS